VVKGTFRFIPRDEFEVGIEEEEEEEEVTTEVVTVTTEIFIFGLVEVEIEGVVKENEVVAESRVGLFF
jgi:hypothetical protein